MVSGEGPRGDYTFLALERPFSPAQRGLIYGKLATGYPEAQRRHLDPIGKLVAWVAKLQAAEVEVAGAGEVAADAPTECRSAGA